MFCFYLRQFWSWCPHRWCELFCGAGQRAGCSRQPTSNERVLGSKGEWVLTPSQTCFKHQSSKRSSDLSFLIEFTSLLCQSGHWCLLWLTLWRWFPCCQGCCVRSCAAWILCLTSLPSLSFGQSHVRERYVQIKHVTGKAQSRLHIEMFLLP